MSNPSPLILVTNDDDITAPGIKVLTRVAAKFGDVVVVAPDRPQSGMGHAISIGKPLRLIPQEKEVDGIARWACNGTPVDCVKLARAEVLQRLPDLLLSGINHGSNSSVSVLYSGTMSAAVEGAIEGIPSIGFSLCDFSHEADFSAAEKVAEIVVGRALANPFPANIALNVNIPKIQWEDLKGIRVTRQSVGSFVEDFDKRKDPYGRDYFWLTGEFKLRDSGQDTDDWALRNGYVSVCPVQIDMTAHHAIAQLNNWGMGI
jgi:5'-nucleotidase